MNGTRLLQTDCSIQWGKKAATFTGCDHFYQNISEDEFLVFNFQPYVMFNFFLPQHLLRRFDLTLTLLPQLLARVSLPQTVVCSLKSTTEEQCVVFGRDL